MAPITMAKMTRIGVLVALVGLGACPLGAMAGETLESRLTPLIQAHKGKVAVAVKNLETGESFAYHADGPVAVCVLTAENEDKHWVADNAGDRLCAEVARAVFDHFPAKSEPKPSVAPAKP